MHTIALWSLICPASRNPLVACCFLDKILCATTHGAKKVTLAGRSFLRSMVNTTHLAQFSTLKIFPLDNAILTFWERIMRSRQFPARETIDRACLSLFLATICLVVYRHFWHGKPYHLHCCLCRYSWISTKLPHRPI